MAGSWHSHRLRLQALLRDELVVAMTAQGWTVDDSRASHLDGEGIVAFRRAVAPEFAAVLAVERSYVWPGRSKLPVRVRTAVSYEPAYRLWPLLGDPPVGELEDWPESTDGEDESRVDLSAEREAPAVVRRLAGFAPAAFAFATNNASVAAILAACRPKAGRVSEAGAQVVPTLLAAAGRIPEARSALATFQGMDEPELSERPFRRYSYLFNRWLNEGAVLPDSPPGPAPRPALRDPLSLAESTKRDRLRAAATTAVRADGKTRQQLRSALEGEWAARGLDLNPVTIELGVDRLLRLREPLGRLQSALWTLGAFTDVGRSVVRLIREYGSNRHPLTEPPDHALCPIRCDPERWIRVPLDAGAQPFLGRVLADSSLRIDSLVRVDAWLAADPLTDVTVHIGTRRIGSLDPAFAEPYRSAVIDAAERGEHPYVEAMCLRNSDNEWLVQIGLPVPMH